MADDQGYGDTGFTGHPELKTPHMDAMAEASVVFKQFYASAPVCSPTRASVLTGRHPIRVNVPNHGHYLRPHETTIAEALKSAGYVTGHFGKWHIGSVQSESPASPGGAGFDEWLSGLNFFDIDPYLSRNGIYEQIRGQGTVITMDATLEFLHKHKDGGKPMFAVTWFPAPHNPQLEQPVNTGGDFRPYEGDNQGYYREIQLIDQQLGRLRAALRKMGIADNTIVWYTSDNGGLVEEHSGGREKKGSIYEGGLRVPAMFEWPSTYQPVEVEVPAFSSDIYPTLVVIADARVSSQPGLDGIDLGGVMEGEQNERPAMGFWHGLVDGQNTESDTIIRSLMQAQKSGQPSPFPERMLKNVNDFSGYPEGRYEGHAAWNQWPWKLHRIQNGDDVVLELYHLVDDPMETKNLATREPGRVNAMRTELEAWQASVFASAAGQDYVPGSY
jgi:arylsulfatase A-like enzyme